MDSNEGTASISGIAMTAIGVAIIRSKESARKDRLYDDPFAEEFVSAARQAFDTERWERVVTLADEFYPGRTIGVRLTDDRVRTAAQDGVRQFVLLGAGLDTRAYRLDLPADATLYEIDLPESFAFKEPVLARAGASSSCDRRVVAADLKGDWSSRLQEFGFRAEVPTCWVEEGTLGHLTQTWTQRVVSTLTGVSAPGSRFAVSRYVSDGGSSAYREYQRLVAGDDTVSPQAALRPESPTLDVAHWLDSLGWRTEFCSWNDLVSGLGRAATVEDPRLGTVTAVRR